jgi:hypothetical protein
MEYLEQPEFSPDLPKMQWAIRIVSQRLFYDEKK